jgi:hypothetical protein
LQFSHLPPLPSLHIGIIQSPSPPHSSSRL